MRSDGAVGYLVDTNVLIYAYDTRDAAKRSRAIAIIRRLGTLRTGALSAQVLGEFFWNATRRLRQPLSEADAEQQLVLWVRSGTVFDITPPIVLEAVRGAQRYRLPYWDALIWATAKLNGVPTVLSEDFNDGALVEGVRFRNPFPPAFDQMAL